MPAGTLVTVPLAPAAASIVTCSLAGRGANSAVTVFDSSIVTTQAPEPVHALDQPTNTDPGSGVAVSVTTVPGSYSASQSLGQSIPAGVLVTFPPENGVDTTDTSRTGFGMGSNVAVTEASGPIVSTQGSVPLQEPDQPTNWDSGSGDAARVTLVPFRNLAAQLSSGQSIASGSLTTAPLPSPSTLTVSNPLSRANLAVTAFAASITTTH